MERVETNVRYENDGTGSYRSAGRYRVQTEAGVQQVGLLRFGYNRSVQEISALRVRVHKPDGTVVETPATVVQEFPADVTRLAPMYTDFQERHVPVAALRPGDIVEFEFATLIKDTLIPGHFFLELTFEKNAVVLEEIVEVDTPAGRPLKFKAAPGYEPEIEAQGERRLFRWRRANLQPRRESPEGSSPSAETQPLAPTPDFQMSTFQSWEEVGQWYYGIQQPQESTTPEIRAKAEELTRGLATDQEKIRALYDFVAQEFRYISLSFGLGRYQPRPAPQVFADRFGDCKDKHTLLAALLKAIGLKAYPSLVHSQRKLDPDVPSPGQFDHLMTVVPTADGYHWLDTTTEVAPYQMLASAFRNKRALVMPGDSPAALVETPADPPFPQVNTLEVEGKVDEQGKVEARIRQTFRGDDELGWRVTFRRTPRHQWKQVTQLLALQTGYFGEVSEVTTSDPAATQEPFRVEYHYTRDDYVTWKKRRGKMKVALPAVSMPRVEEKAPDPPPAIKLGPLKEFVYRTTMEIPPGTTAVQPTDVVERRDYADYHSTYRIENRTVRIERRLRVLQEEVAPTLVSDYQAFRQTVSNDQNFDLAIVKDPPTEATAKTAEELEEVAQRAVDDKDFRTATRVLEKLVELEPSHPTAWGLLGRVRLERMQIKEAEEALLKQLAVDPSHQNVHRSLAMAHMLQGDPEKAEAFALRQLEIRPTDSHARALLGWAYSEQGRYSEATTQLEAAVKENPTDGSMLVMLAQSYLGAGLSEKALATFEQFVELDPGALGLNNVAYMLAEKNVHLDHAQKWAEAAVKELEAELAGVGLSQLSRSTFNTVASLAATWDTVGWTYYQQGRLEEAEQYLLASWLTWQQATIAEHLAAIYERKGDGAKAGSFRRLADATPRTPQNLRELSAALTGGNPVVVETPSLQATEELQNLRTIKLKRRKKASEHADFYILLAPGPRVEEVSFISGSENLKDWAETLKATEFPVKFPAGSQAKIPRRGVLSCNQYSGECIFVLYELDQTIRLQ